MIKLRLYAVFFLLFCGISLQAQTVVRCSTEEAEALLRAKNPKTESKESFESWLVKKISTLRKSNPLGKTEETVYTIPVVVHVIHNGEAIGTGSNISLAQINSQIDILNKDYRRLNTDASSTRTSFLPVAADCSIEFKLAITDPDNLPTDGIVRVKGSQTSWSINDNDKIKATSYWPSKDYLNLWVCNLGSSLLGYAQFPESDLKGLSSSDLDQTTFNNSRNPLTDGVVISYKYFGTTSSASYGSGRTATHEVGHYLGLRHIWGDQSSCGTSGDFCDDTPEVNSESYGCKTTKKGCDTTKLAMVENYMDYSDDKCMNIFTLDQKNRMRTVLENSPRRLSLLTSPGLQPAVLIPNDAGIRTMLSPNTKSYCSNSSTYSLAPKFVLKNYGNNALTSVTISYQYDNQSSQTINWTGNLASLGADTISLTTTSLALGSHTFRVNTFQPNNTTDLKSTNDTLFSDFTVTQTGNVPFTASFNSGGFPPTNWSIINSDALTTWEVTSALGSLDVGNKAMFIDLFDYDDNGKGEQDFLNTNAYDFSNVSQATLIFKVSYSQYKDATTSSNDGLSVLASTDCGSTFSKTLYSKFGTELGTVKSSTTSWQPKYLSDWRTEIIDLSSSGLLGQSNVSFSFVSSNDFGNNIYVDDIQVALVTASEPAIASQNNTLVYPNPNDGSFNIAFDLDKNQNVDVNIYDIMGKQVWNNHYDNVLKDIYQLSIPQLSAGMYFLKVTGKNALFNTHKIIVK